MTTRINHGIGAGFGAAVGPLVRTKAAGALLGLVYSRGENCLVYRTGRSAAAAKDPADLRAV